MAPRACSIALVALLAACSPTLDWREVRVDGSPLIALFPCKPDRYERQVQVEGQAVRMRMQSCAAGGLTFSVSHFELADAAAVSPALRSLRRSMAANLGAADPALRDAAVVGANPQPEAGRTSIEGRLPDGRAARAEAVFFAAGARVHQASIVGDRPAGEAADTFFAGLRVVR